MNVLRVLTGAHSGATLRLDKSEYVIGTGPEVDVELSDWKHANVRITLKDEGKLVTVSSLACAADVDPDLGILEPLLPRRFGDVVLCAGSSDARWPSDLKLLERLMGSKDEATGDKARAKPAAVKEAAGARALMHRLAHSRGATWAAASLGVTLMAAFLNVVAHGGAPAQPVPAEPLVMQVQRLVRQSQSIGVSAHKQPDGRVLVDGLVDDEAQLVRLHQALDVLRREQVVVKVAAATEVARTIGDALGNPGLSVRYRGDGEFEVIGSSQDLEHVRAELHRITSDLAPVVARIDVSARELPPPSIIPTDAILASEDVQYVQTRDGTKHLSLSDPPPPPENAASAADGPP